MKTSDYTKVILSGLMLIFVFVVLLFSTYAWFSSNKNSQISGSNVSIKVDSSLKIYKDALGEDIGVTEITEDTIHIENQKDDKEYSTIQPGATGYFDFYVENNESSHTDSYTYRFQIEIVVNPYKTNGGFADGASEANKVLSLTYVNSHILFFENCSTETGSRVYSDWIPASEIKNFSFVETSEEYLDHRTIYWVWVQDYADIFGSYNSCISSEDKQQIKTYFTENRELMFNEDVINSDSYDSADYIIGTSLKYICFELTFS